ncbi:hypothetical protein GcC1_040012 [Golovinomyces cichoracearum]|uniref:Uncharacterized protein n=1 Tax=Golovinomyces cichoracearum TaxID=62708 RepID=A0A420IZQ7_9PEZI|nr:hypothetical protein GcC1_040012 [Golovinomyces cichoracearum]
MIFKSKQTDYKAAGAYISYHVWRNLIAQNFTIDLGVEPIDVELTAIQIVEGWWRLHATNTQTSPRIKLVPLGKAEHSRPTNSLKNSSWRFQSVL